MHRHSICRVNARMRLRFAFVAHAHFGSVSAPRDSQLRRVRRDSTIWIGWCMRAHLANSFCSVAIGRSAQAQPTHRVVCNTRTYIYLFNEYYLRYHSNSPTQNVSRCDNVLFARCREHSFLMVSTSASSSANWWALGERGECVCANAHNIISFWPLRAFLFLIF